MEVTFSVNLDLSKNKRDEKSHSNACNKISNCLEVSNVEKWLDLAQKIVKSVKIK